MNRGTASKLVSFIMIVVTLFVPVWSTQSRAEDAVATSSKDTQFIDQQKKATMYSTYRWVAEMLGKDPEDPLVIQGISNWAHGLGIGLIVGIYGAWKRQGDAKALTILLGIAPPLKNPAQEPQRRERASKRLQNCADGWSLMYPLLIGGSLVAGSAVGLSYLNRHVEETEGTNLEGLDERRKADRQAQVLKEQDEQTAVKLAPAIPKLAPIFKNFFGGIRADILDDPAYAGISETERKNLEAKIETTLAPATIEQKVSEFWKGKAHLFIRRRVAPGQKPTQLLATILASDEERGALAIEMANELTISVLGTKYAASMKPATREAIQEAVNEALRSLK